MNSSGTEGLNYFPFLGQQQSPPTSSRTMPNPCVGGGCGGGGGAFTGGQTTRRSLPKNLHGNYEGDFSMFTSRTMNQAAAAAAAAGATTGGSSLMDQILEAGLDLRLDQHFDATTTSEDHLDDLDETDEMVDEEIRAKIAEKEISKTAAELSASLKQSSMSSSSSPMSSVSQSPHSHSHSQSKSKSQSPSLWQCYKGKIFSEAQCQKIDLALCAMQQNSVLRKISHGGKFAALMITCVLRLLLSNVVMRVVNVGWNGARCRTLLRKGSRRLLWCMTLAKCGDVQLFGLIMLLAPMVFIIAALGFIFALYCVIKHGIQSLIRHIRYIDIEVPQIED